MSLCMSVGVGGLGSFNFPPLILFAVSFFSVVFNLCKALCATFLYEKHHTNTD